MSKEMGVIMLGLAVVLTPQLGIPDSWKVVVLSLLGLGVMLLGFLLRGQLLTRSGHTTSPESRPFVENTEHTELRS